MLRACVGAGMGNLPLFCAKKLLVSSQLTDPWRARSVVPDVILIAVNNAKLRI
jgi:hypothetical protein